MSNNYKSIAKANALFGGVQVYRIIIGILRSKAIALLLGPEGMGIMGLYNSSVDLVKQATGFGLNTSAVRDVAIANSEGNQDRIISVYSVLSKLVWVTGFLGTIVMLLFARQLSIYTFESENYTIGFRILSVVLLTYQLTVRNNVLLQGLRKLKDLAKANVIGSTLGLIVIPLYYLWGYSAIVPSIIIVAVISYIVTQFYVHKMQLSYRQIDLKESLKIGKTMLLMGFLLSLTSFMDVIQAYFIKIYISRWGGVPEVGLYNAGFGLITTYVGLVFNAIGTDYYSRLSMVCNDKHKYNQVINEQLEIMLLVLTPLLVFFISFSKILVYILYSEDFYPITMMVNLMCVGMVLRAINWCQGYMFLAKGDSIIYSISYVMVFIIAFALYLGGYYKWGLTGIGIAFIGLYLYCTLTGIGVTWWLYRCVYYKTAYKLMTYSLGMTIITVLVTFLSRNYTFIYTICVLLIICSSIISYRGLNSRLDISVFIKNKLRKRDEQSKTD